MLTLKTQCQYESAITLEVTKHSTSNKADSTIIGGTHTCTQKFPVVSFKYTGHVEVFIIPKDIDTMYC